MFYKFILLSIEFVKMFMIRHTATEYEIERFFFLIILFLNSS